MVIAFHIILTGHAHWLPNGPRGSKSRSLRKERLGELGGIHHGRKPRQPPPEEIRRFHREARRRLDHPAPWFDEAHRRAIGEAFGRVVRERRLTCRACSVLRNHAHLLVRKHRLPGEEIARRLKDASRQALISAGLAYAGHPVWSENDCAVFRDTPRAVREAADYIWGNFGKHRIAPRRWPFVAAYDTRPFHKKRRASPAGLP